ncbi:hypothetical protein Tco_1401161 [Tanacetum coccineum]
MMKEMSYKLLKDDQKKQLGKNNKAKMTLYNTLPRKEYERVFMCKTAKERAKVTAIEETKDLATLSLGEIISNLKLKLPGNKLVTIAIVKEEVLNVDEEEAKAFNLMAMNLCSEKATVISLETKAMKAQDKREFAIIAGRGPLC